MGKGQIAGILQGLGCLLRAVTGGAPAVQQLRSARNMLRSATGKSCIQGDGTAIQSRRHGHHLKGGTWLVTVGNTAVAPLL